MQEVTCPRISGRSALRFHPTSRGNDRSLADAKLCSSELIGCKRTPKDETRKRSKLLICGSGELHGREGVLQERGKFRVPVEAVQCGPVASRGFKLVCWPIATSPPE